MNVSRKIQYHASLSIDTLLELDCFDLIQCCQAHPQGVVGIRRSLVLQQERGIEYLVPAGCDNVADNGECLGHSLPVVVRAHEKGIPA